ncbi:MAG: hypothetical protein WBA22_14320, partial [Candidatus Methanofastidiosia archaeon]
MVDSHTGSIDMDFHLLSRPEREEGNPFLCRRPRVPSSCKIEDGDLMEERPEEKEDYLTEHFNLAFILRGHVKELEAVKEYIVTEYVRKNTLRMIKPVYDKRRLYIMTESQW